ncbi:MAG: formimidoylglutamase [Bacteroidales bacterium]|nr:formimidoylglutamase [Bacteroidales bacterium]
MDISTYFEPLDPERIGFSSNEFMVRIGDRISTYYAGSPWPGLDGCNVALLGVCEGRGSVQNPGSAEAPDCVRRYLYRLAVPCNGLHVADLGNIVPGQSKEDTYFALTEVMYKLLERGIVVVVLGGGDDLVLPIYKAYEIIGRVINICSVDSRFNLEGGPTPNSLNYLQHIVMQQPNYLFDYTNIGYQGYFVGPEMVQLMNELKFDAVSVGTIQPSMERAEPLIRYADLVSVDVSAMRQSDAPANADPSPHGFHSEQVCQLARFAGMSDKTSCFAVTELNPAYDLNGMTAHAMAHAVWFFIEGVYNRKQDYPYIDKHNYKRFTVELRDQGTDIVFYKSKKSDRWWMEVPCLDEERRARYAPHLLVPCNHSDYECAMQNELPELWWKFYNRING